MKRIWLKDLRKKRNLTQAAVSKRASISRAYYTEIENGIKTPSPIVAQKLSIVLGFDWTKFFACYCSDSQH